MVTGLNIVVVEDHEDLLALTVEVLRKQGHHVTGLTCAEAIDDEGGGRPIDLLILDLNLPGEDGLSLARRFRCAQPGAAIIMTTARNRIADRVAGYNSGADMYLPKPVSPAELVAAVNAVGRRLQSMQGVPQSWNAALTLSMPGLRLRGNSGEVHVSGSEAAILAALARAPGHRLESWQLLELLGEDHDHYQLNSLQVRLTRLRGKMTKAGAEAHGLRSLRSQGYQLCVPLTVR